MNVSKNRFSKNRFEEINKEEYILLKDLLDKKAKKTELIDAIQTILQKNDSYIWFYNSIECINGIAHANSVINSSQNRLGNYKNKSLSVLIDIVVALLASASDELQEEMHNEEKLMNEQKQIVEQKVIDKMTKNNLITEIRTKVKELVNEELNRRNSIGDYTSTTIFLHAKLKQNTQNIYLSLFAFEDYQLHYNETKIDTNIYNYTTQKWRKMRNLNKKEMINILTTLSLYDYATKEELFNLCRKVKRREKRENKDERKKTQRGN